jgi:hypothetical protein
MCGRRRGDRRGPRLSEQVRGTSTRYASLSLCFFVSVCLGADVLEVKLLWCSAVCVCAGTNRPSSMHVDDYETHAR